jgi:hypothetical protein
MHPFHAFMALLRFDRHGGNGAGFQAAERNRLSAFLAIAIGAVFDSLKRLINLVDQFARPIPGAEFKCPVRFNRSAICEIRLSNATFGKGGKRLTRFPYKVLPPSEKLLPEIFQLKRIPRKPRDGNRAAMSPTYLLLSSPCTTGEVISLLKPVSPD